MCNTVSMNNNNNKIKRKSENTLNSILFICFIFTYNTLYKLVIFFIYSVFTYIATFVHLYNTAYDLPHFY